MMSLSQLLLFFFFSSRRRHTRCLSDWSSDVCSSDLIRAEQARFAFPGDNDLLTGKEHLERYLLPLAGVRELASSVTVATVVAVGRKRSEESRVGKECRCGRLRAAENKHT